MERHLMFFNGMTKYYYGEANSTRSFTNIIQSSSKSNRKTEIIAKIILKGKAEARLVLLNIYQNDNNHINIAALT